MMFVIMMTYELEATIKDAYQSCSASALLL